MLLRRLRTLAIAITGTLASVPALAQQNSTVTVAPITAGAPALGWSGLAILALALGAVAVLMLRRADRAATRAVGVVVLLMAVAVTYATPDVIISGDECHQVTQKTYPPFTSPDLESQCSNPIRIVDLQLACDDAKSESVCDVNNTAPPTGGDGGPVCAVGLVIPAGGMCHLPSCPC